MTNTSGTKIKDYRFDAFGNQLNADANDTNPFRYCGEYTDSETGNIYLRARYYDPGIGRFISEDPIQDGGNWYVYCGGNPVNFSDPTGLSIVLKDYQGEDDPRIKNLRALTNDTLTVNKKGKVEYTITETEGDKPVGSGMLREIIDCEKDVKIVFTDEEGGSCQNSWVNGEFAGAVVYFNPDYSPEQLTYDENGQTSSKVAKPPQISLGHELIHVVRAINKRYNSSGVQGTYWYKDESGAFVESIASIEELETVGIPYFIVNSDKSWNLFFPQYQYAYTENALRAELNPPMGARANYETQ